ncbi:MAG: site-specific integrase [Acidobacteriota bacterium]
MDPLAMRLQPQWQPGDGRLYVWKNPGKVVDRSGYSVDTSGEVWVLNEPTRYMQLDWSKMDVQPDLKDSLKAFIAFQIEAKASRTVSVFYDELLCFLTRLAPQAGLQDLTYLRFEATLTRMRTDGTMRHFPRARQWYRWCADRGIPGFSRDLSDRLDEFRVPRSLKHLAVMTRDTKRGPLNDQEHWLLRQAVKERKGSPLARVAVMLLLELGQRPTQLVLLEEEDFRMTESPEGHRFYSLRIPRMKQRTVGSQEKKRRGISLDLARALEELIEQNHKHWGTGTPHLPLLCRPPQWGPLRISPALRSRYQFHLSSTEFKNLVARFALHARILSPRTGQHLHLFPYRLRYTLATRLAAQGAPAQVIAELLDHSGTDDVLVYIRSTPNITDYLDAALGKSDQYLATIDRFQGKLIPRAGDENPASIIYGNTPTRKSLGGIGVCGLGSLCSLYPPLSCYLCPKFTAWKEGPHEQMLQELETYVQQLREQSGNPSDRIPYQLAETLRAIRNVLRQIQGGQE